MIKRYLENKVKLRLDEDSEKFCNNMIELEYYLIESESDGVDDMKNKKVFGIEIVKRENENYTERELIRNFSCCRESTRHLLGKLASNTVTPMGLPFVLDNIIGA